MEQDISNSFLREEAENSFENKFRTGEQISHTNIGVDIDTRSNTNVDMFNNLRSESVNRNHSRSSSTSSMSVTSNKQIRQKWKDTEDLALLNVVINNSQLLTQIEYFRPMKNFWIKISNLLFLNFNYLRNSRQCHDRFKVLYLKAQKFKYNNPNIQLFNNNKISRLQSYLLQLLDIFTFHNGNIILRYSKDNNNNGNKKNAEKNQNDNDNDNDNNNDSDKSNRNSIILQNKVFNDMDSKDFITVSPNDLTVTNSASNSNLDIPGHLSDYKDIYFIKDKMIEQQKINEDQKIDLREFKTVQQQVNQDQQQVNQDQQQVNQDQQQVNQDQQQVNQDQQQVNQDQQQVNQDQRKKLREFEENMYYKEQKHILDHEQEQQHNNTVYENIYGLISNLKHELDSLEKEVSHLKTQISSLESQNESQATIIQKLFELLEDNPNINVPESTSADFLKIKDQASVTSSNKSND